MRERIFPKQKTNLDMFRDSCGLLTGFCRSRPNHLSTFPDFADFNPTTEISVLHDGVRQLVPDHTPDRSIVKRYEDGPERPPLDP